MILIIDTSSSKIRLLFDAQALDFESQKQSLDLPRLVDQITNKNYSGISAIGVITGPGSFTGIRLGISFAKGLAMGLSVPLVGINIFELGAGDVRAIDSGRGDYFIYDMGSYKISKELPVDANIILNYDLQDAVKVVNSRKNNPEIVIPLYIRPSYVDR